MNPKTFFHLSLAILALLLIWACGGSGGSASTKNLQDVPLELTETTASSQTVKVSGTVQSLIARQKARFATKENVQVLSLDGQKVLGEGIVENGTYQIEGLPPGQAYIIRVSLADGTQIRAITPILNDSYEQEVSLDTEIAVKILEQNFGTDLSLVENIESKREEALVEVQSQSPLAVSIRSLINLIAPQLGQVEEKIEVLALPKAPIQLKTDVDDGQALLIWEPVDGAVNYEIYLSQQNQIEVNSNRDGDQILQSKTHSVQITGLSNEKEYHVWVKAKNVQGWGEWSNRLSFWVEAKVDTEIKFLKTEQGSFDQFIKTPKGISLNENSEELTLWLDGKEWVVKHSRTSFYKNEVFTWQGVIEGQRGYVLLSKHKNVWTGEVQIYQEGVYRFEHVSSGVYQFKKVDLKQNFPKCGISWAASETSDGFAVEQQQVGALIQGDGDIVDLMVLYNANAKGAVADINTTITNAVESVNLTFRNSKIQQRMRLVHMEEISYVEANDLNTDLDRLINPSDGIMDNAHTLRDTYGADLVSLFVRDAGNLGGLASIPGYFSLNFESRGFSVVRIAQAGAPSYTLAHELGHNFGCLHQRGEPSIASSTPLLPYAYGWRVLNQFKTVMSYGGNEYPSIPYFSNPDVSYNSLATGNSGTEDNARVINHSRRYTTNLRTAKVQSIVASVDSLTVNENNTATMNVRLGSKPSSNITVTVTKVSGDADIFVTIPATSLTFTSNNWNQSQVVQVFAKSDVDTTAGTAVVRCSASGLSNVDITVTEVDNNAGSTTGLISGSIKEVTSNVPVVGATVTIENVGNVTTDSEGVFTKVVSLGWTGSITATRSGLTIVGKSQQTVDAANPILNADLTANRGHTILYVKSDASGSGDGSSWANAYTDLAEALRSPAHFTEVWVAKGTYKPGEARSDSFDLPPNIKVYGHFAGTETLLSQRQLTNAQNTTILSGDIGTSGTDSDNSYHVVWAADQTTLDGFTVELGNASENFTDERGKGGGVYFKSGQVTIENCIVKSNKARQNGGGIYTETGNLIVKNSTIESNSNTGNGGGGVYVKTGTLDFDSVVVKSNTSTLYGGGIQFQATSSAASSCKIHKSTFEGNQDSSNGGGAIYATNVNFDIQDSSFKQNSGSLFAGAIYSDTGSVGTIKNSVFDGNTNTGNGGGAIYAKSNGPSIENCEFKNNTANLNGGAVYASAVNMTIKNCTFTSNKSLVNNGGGALAIVSGGTGVTLQASTFTSNTAKTAGGAIRITDTPVTMTDCVFVSNVATSNSGGAIYWKGGSTARQMSNCKFYGNSGGWGGAFTISSMTGGFSAINCLFIGNKATATNGGGGMGTAEGSAVVNLVHCTVTQNTASNNGFGGAYIVYSGSTLNVFNSIVWGNTATIVNDIHANTDTVTLNTSIYDPSNSAKATGGTLTATGTIHTDPLFKDANGADNTAGTLDDDLSLQANSPAIDKADSGVTNYPSKDINGVTRVDINGITGGAGNPNYADIGAFEYQASAASPGMTLSSSNLTVAENGGSGTFTVVLDAAPSGTVVVDLSSSDVNEATVQPSSLSFNLSNWSTAQTVTVTGVNDQNNSNDTATITVSINDAQSEDNYDSVADKSVSVTLTNDDTTVAGMTLSKTSMTLAENGGTDTFTVKLNAAPSTDVVVNITSASTNEATVDKASLTFTSSNWSTAQTVTVTGVNDNTVGQNQTTITVSINDASSDNTYDNVADQSVTVTLTDDDAASAGITLSKSSLTVAENAGTGNFTVVLDAAPTSNVVLNLSSSTTGDLTLSSSTLTFTSSNWSTAQTVTVTGVDDKIDRNDSSVLTISVDGASSDDTYDNVANKAVTVTLTDDDTAGMTLSPSALTIAENGGTGTFTIVLNSEPNGLVVISVSSDSLAEAKVNVNSATFTSANWNVAKTVTVTGVNDSVDAEHTSKVTVKLSFATASEYQSLQAQTVNLSLTDDDEPPGVILSTTSASVAEKGGTGTFTVKLASDPGAPVTINIQSSDTNEATVSPASLSFSFFNWNQAQTVTVTGVDDQIAATHTANITLDIVSVNPAYGLLADKVVAIQLIDDDVPGMTLSKNALTVAENGGTETFTVVLNVQPTNNVVLTVGSSDSGEATVDKTTLTFTNANWNQAQTVTVTGVDDNKTSNDQASISVGVNTQNSDASYSNVSSQSVSVTLTNDDVSGIQVTAGTGQVSEAGQNDSFQIVLKSQPSSDVVFSLTSTDTTEGTISPASLTFTASNWNIAQTVIVTGVDDKVDDDNVSFKVTIPKPTTNDTTYSSIDPNDLDYSNTDNDTAGITVSQASSSETDESGSTVTFTAVLDSEPTDSVSLSLKSSDTTEGTVSPASLTFSPSNWSTVQTVTVTGVDDQSVDGDISYKITFDPATSNDAKYNGKDPSDINLTNKDHGDLVGVKVSALTGSTSESGGTATFTVVLNSEPLSSVTFPMTSSDTTEGTVPASIIFTTSNWNTAQTVTVTGVDDDAVDGNISYTIQLTTTTSSDSNYIIDPEDMTVVNQDNDTAGVTVSAISGDLNESGSTATFTIKLNAQPLKDVVVSLSSSDTGEGTVSPANVTFTSANWSTTQTVTVTGEDDFIDDGDVSFKIITSATASQDAGFNGVAIDDISVKNVDDDTAGITTTTPAGAVSESGTTTTFTVVLKSAPIFDVTVPLSSSDTTEGSVSPSSLTFTSSNWNTAQTVTVKGIDDGDVDGNITYQIVLGAITSTDTSYSGLDAADVSVTTNDDDTAGLKVTQTQNFTSEAGASASFGMVLTAKPSADVTVSFVSSSTGEGTVNPSSMTFTSSNWDTQQSLTVTGVDDLVQDGDIAYTIMISTLSSSDANFAAVDPADLSLTNTDNDVAGISVSALSGSTSEAGATASFTVVLNTQPTNDVVIGVSSSDTTEGSVSPSSLTFTSSNWNTVQTVTVTGVDDSIDDEQQSYQVILAAATSNDVNYQGKDPSDFTLETSDDDTAGVTVSAIAGQTSEDGGTATFTMKLHTEPTADVTVSLNSSDTSEGTLPASITFTSANWNTAQTVTVTGANDDLDDGNIKYTALIGPFSSNDTKYNGMDPSDLEVTNVDNDTAGISVSSISGDTSESGTTATFTVVLNTKPATDVTVTLSSSDTTEGVISPSSLTFTSSNWNAAQTVTVTGQDDSLDDDAISYEISFSKSSSLDTAYSGLSLASLSLKNDDDDYSISGKVNVTGVKISLIDSQGSTSSVDVDSSGYFSAIFKQGWTGKVVPSKTDYTFEPASDQLSNLSSNINNLNYTATKEVNAVDSSTFKFEWDAVAGASYYYLRVINSETRELLFYESRLTTNVYVPAQSFLKDVSYVWYVRSYVNNQWSDWSEEQSVTFPSSDSGEELSGLNWTAVSGATKYRVWIRDDSTNLKVIDDQNVLTNSYTPANGTLTTGNRYTWWYMAFANGSWTAWKGPKTFTQQ